MSSEDIVMDEEAPKWPTAKGKGKAKAVDPADVVAEAENLPW